MKIVRSILIYIVRCQLLYDRAIPWFRYHEGKGGFVLGRVPTFLASGCRRGRGCSGYGDRGRVGITGRGTLVVFILCHNILIIGIIAIVIMTMIQIVIIIRTGE